MSTAIPPALDRKFRTASVLDRFRNRPFSWADGANCIHLFREQLVAFGHALPPVPNFRTPRGAARALKESGFDSLQAVADHYLPRIRPAEMWLGDIAMLPGEPFDALAIYAGSSTVVAWHSNDPEPMRNIVVNTADFKAAWRVLPR